MQIGIENVKLHKAGTTKLTSNEHYDEDEEVIDGDAYPLLGAIKNKNPKKAKA